MQEVKNAEDFLRGQSDCDEGLEHKPGMSADYDRGYSNQYELEQVKTYLSECSHG